MIRFIVSLLFVMQLFIAPHVLAQESIVKDIAVVDVIQLLRDSKAAQSIEKQIKTKRQAFQKDISAREKELRALEEELINEREGADPDAFNEKRRVFEKGLRELQTDTQKKRFALDKASAQAIATLRSEITKITAEIANQNDYKLVITRDQVVIVTSDIDITQQVLAELNKRLNTVKVEME